MAIGDTETLSILDLDGIVKEMLVDIENKMIIGTIGEKEKEMEQEFKVDIQSDFSQTMFQDCFSRSFKLTQAEEHSDLKPERVIYNGRTTICIWKDGTKTVVKATGDDTMTHEHGVAMSFMRKLFSSRQEFLRVVNGGYDVIEESQKRAREKTIRRAELEARKKEAETRKEEAEAKEDFSEGK